LIAVENDFFRPFGRNCGATLAAEDGVLLSLFGADVVPPVAFAVRGGLVSLLDVAEHLVVELLAQGSQVGGEGLSVLVFGLEIGGDVGIFLVAKPRIVVSEGDAVEDGLFVVFSGDGGGGGCAFGHGNLKCSGRRARRRWDRVYPPPIPTLGVKSP